MIAMGKKCWRCDAEIVDSAPDDLDEMCDKCRVEYTCSTCSGDESALTCEGAHDGKRCRCRACHPMNARQRVEARLDAARALGGTAVSATSGCGGRRFSRAVQWEVEMTFVAEAPPLMLTIEARSAPKAARAARRRLPGCTPTRVTLLEPERVPAGAELASLEVGREHRVRSDRSWWVFSIFADGMMSIAERGTGHRRSVLPPYVLLDLRTAGDAARYAARVWNIYSVIADVAVVLLHRVVLSAPALYPAPALSHVTVGAHPDGRGGYCCVTDPGGVQISCTQVAGRGLRDEVHEPDRSAFAAGAKFVEIVGEAGAQWAIDRARKKAGGWLRRARS